MLDQERLALEDFINFALFEFERSQIDTVLSAHQMLTGTHNSTCYKCEKPRTPQRQYHTQKVSLRQIPMRHVQRWRRRSIFMKEFSEN